MNLQQIEKTIEEHIALVTLDSRGLAEAGMRASKFLVVSSVLSTYLRGLETELGKIDAHVEATFAQACQRSSAKNVTGQKLDAAMDQNVIGLAELKSSLEAQRTWIRTHIKIFENSHILYRQFGKE